MKMQIRINLLLAISFVLVPALYGQSISGVDSLEWRFQVYLDNKPIGWHAFRVEQDGPVTSVETEARFDVKILFITAYRYRHRNVEQYDGTGLLSIDAYTDANGKKSVIRGERGEAYFRLTGGVADKLPVDLKAFCYWTPSILEESRLLNSQTGEYEEVEIIERGESVISYRGESIPARQFDIMVKGLPVSIWYSIDDNRWLALESLTKKGRVLRYEPESLPESGSPGQNLLARLD
jgi:hypothetical protein